MRTALRAGIAVYNAGEYHGAHDAWEDHWLDLESGSDDERFLHGLIQFTAALHHARNGNWHGLAGLVESARAYLDGLPEDYRDVNVEEVRTYLDALHADPEHVERVAPPALTHEGEAVTPADLAFDEAAIAAEIVAEEHESYEEEPVGRAIASARESVEAGESDRFVGLVMDFAAGEHRDLVYRRLCQHVRRREREQRDVDGLFEGGTDGGA